MTIPDRIKLSKENKYGKGQIGSWSIYRQKLKPV